MKPYFVFTVFLLAPMAMLSADDGSTAKPSIVFIMADELGYYEPGFNGGQNIATPNLDRMAADGIRFRNMYAGASVCAPTRCCLMTGKHGGHTSVRANDGGTPLRADEVTIASLLKQQGYATGGFGKWGCGGRDSTGVPEKHGFDAFFGYYDQVHAHSYYPPYLIRNSEEVPLKGNTGPTGETYSHYEIHNAAVEFIRENAEKPFFAYLPYTPPHGTFQIPDIDPAWAIYKDKPWPEQAKRYAAMVGMLDRQVGEILALLKELKIDENTLVIFCGDNGGNDYFSDDEHPRGFHSANKDPVTGVEFRGKKGGLYEGSLRVPFIARWPGQIEAGRVTDLISYFPDMLPTIAEMAGTETPANVDGVSIVETMFGINQPIRIQEEHEFLYWETGNNCAIRMGNWRGVRIESRWELYDLLRDPSETNDLASRNPAIVSRFDEISLQEHTPIEKGTYTSTARHERDRRAKTGQQDNPGPAGKPGDQLNRPPSAMPTMGILSNKDWTIVRASSENSDNKKFATNAIDGDPTTIWHSRFSGTVAQPPHELVIDLGTERMVRGFVCMGRQDAGWNGAARNIEFCLSADPEKFGEPVAKTELKKQKLPESIECPATAARFVLLRILDSHGPKPLGSMAEIGIIGE